MQTLVEEPFFGCWRSYKTFKRSGIVQLHNEELFEEFSFENDRQLSIYSFDGAKKKNIATTDTWSIEFNSRRHYLSIPILKRKYEVITINHTCMVLMDTDSHNKTFFAKDCFWKSYLKSNRLQIL